MDADEQNYSKFMKATLKMGHFWIEKMILFWQVFLDKMVSYSWISPEIGVFHGRGMEDIGCDFGKDCSDINGDMNV